MSNKAIARRILEEEISKRNFALTAELVHPDFYDHTNPPGMERGHAGHQAIINLFHSAFSNMCWAADDMIEEGDRVAVSTTFTGRHTGEFFGVPASGADVVVKGVHVMRFKDGKLIEHSGANDDLGLMRQIGAIPA
jgi:predicted ester cyclase